MSQHEELMRQALEEARRGAALGEVPVGAVLVCENQVIARAHNLVETRGDATQHAELLALQGGAAQRGTWRLEGCSLYVTLEPCPMCIGAILLSRLDAVYFGAYDPVQGACGSIFDLSAHSGLPRQVLTYPLLLAEESKKLLQDFFRAQR